LSFVLAILRSSFRSLAKASVPLAFVSILAACGGGTPTKAVSTRLVRGPGYTFAAPVAWETTHGVRAVAAYSGKDRVSVTTYTLLKPYRPALFPAAAKELDGVAARLAAEAGKTVTQRQTVVVDGRKTRAYRFGSMRIGFVLDGRSEYQLLCAPQRNGDPDGACALLFTSFALRSS
jgi:hypothetical protein